MLVPTILVFFFIYTPWEAWVVVKYQFYRSWNEYMGKLLGYVLLAFAACAACYGACRWLSPDNTILSLLLRCVIVGVIYPGIWLGVTGRTAEWKQLWGILRCFCQREKGRISRWHNLYKVGVIPYAKERTAACGIRG